MSVLSERIKTNNCALYYCLLDYKDRNPDKVIHICGELKGVSEMNRDQITRLIKRMINQALNTEDNKEML